MGCYTILSGCRLPWPPSCCLDRPTPFWSLMCRQRCDWSPSGGPRTRADETRYRFIPTGQFCLPKRAHSAADAHTGDVHFKFENPSPTVGTPTRAPANHSLYRTLLRPPEGAAAGYPEGYFGREPATGGSIGLSPLCSSRTIDLHVRTASGFDRRFHRRHPARE